MKINSATRILKICQLAQMNAGNNSLLDVWKKVFGIEESRNSIAARNVTRHLNKLNDEISLLLSKSSNLDISPQRYLTAIEKLEEAVSSHNLTQPWQVAGQYLDQGTITSLEFLTDLLPNEEVPIPEESLQTLLELLSELETLLSNSKLSDHLISVIQIQIDIIKVAISNYGISGIAVLKSATATLYGEITLNREELLANPNPEVMKLAQVFQTLARTVDQAQPVGAKLSIAYKQTELLGNISK